MAHSSPHPAHDKLGSDNSSPQLKTEEGYGADIVPTYILREILCGHSADILPTLCGHISPGIYVRTISLFGFQLW